MRSWIMIIVILALGYIIGARMPGLAQRFGIA